jgi:hypothetical protein
MHDRDEIRSRHAPGHARNAGRARAPPCAGAPMGKPSGCVYTAYRGGGVRVRAARYVVRSAHCRGVSVCEL